MKDLFRSSSDSEGSDAEDDGTETQVDQSDEICLHELEENDILAENDDSGEDESAVVVSRGRDIAWSTKEPSFRRFPIRNIKRFSAGIPSTVSVSSAVDCFRHFITNELLDIIVHFTNQQENELKVSGKLVDWRDTDRCELLSFLGLLILYGIQKSRGKPIDEFWDSEYGTPLFCATMSRRQYRDILRSLRFDDRITRLERKERTGNKAEAVQEIFDLFAVQCQTSFIPSSNITVDEHLCVYRGRCSFKVYIPSKPGKYGIKIWCAVDCEHGYMTNLQMYTGRSGDMRELNQGKRVVLDLVRHLADSGMNITTDNFFTSYDLGQELLKMKLTLVGTLRSTRKEVPKGFLPSKTREECTTRFAYSGKTLLVSYVPKRNKAVLLLSTQHQSFEVPKENNLKRKPEVVLYYNSTKSGVDTLDQMSSYYSVKKGTKHWPLAVFYDLVDLAALNAYRLFCVAVEKTERRLFLMKLAKEMAKPQVERRLSLPQARNKDIISSIKQCGFDDLLDNGHPDVIPDNQKRKRGRCSICPPIKGQKLQFNMQKV
ncbi:piggyBac transposable element-derived protein 4-like [Schistocerca piceifrons]|uniref:piggyBac transposable element-derived protein 4-like n=1 Tax=Schistocerca piceifrons TaxID=274613 RepID=UPI001F5F5D95|nr:piggyBac transposable element-derived protein 4-like [Schistocerca piceifrons]